MKNQFKILLAGLVMAGFLFSALRTEAYPPFVRKSAKFGAKDCLFCHTQAGGGEGWNERGNWLIAEKDKRKADAIDVEWLAEYKEPGAADAPKEGEKKPEEKPPAEKPPSAAVAAVDHSAHNHAEHVAATSPETASMDKSTKTVKKTKTKAKRK